MLYSGQPFFMLPEAALESDTFFDLFASSAKGMLLLILMRDAARSYNHWSPKCVAALKQQGRVCAEYSYDALAAKCRVSRRTIITWVNDFEARGLIRKLPQSDHDRNLFQVGQRVSETAPVTYFANDLFLQEAARIGEIDHSNDTTTVVLPPTSDPQITPQGSDPEITPWGDPQITPPGDLEITQDTDGSHAQTGLTTNGRGAVGRSPSSSPRVIALAGEAPTHEDRVAGRQKKGKPGRSSDQAGGLLGRTTDTLKPATPTTSRNPKARQIIGFFAEKYVELLGRGYKMGAKDVAAVEDTVNAMGDTLDAEKLMEMLIFTIENGKRIKQFNDDPTLTRVFHDRWFNKLYGAAVEGKLPDLLEMTQKHTAGSAEAAQEIKSGFSHLKW